MQKCARIVQKMSKKDRRVDFSLPIYSGWTKVNPTFKCNYWDKKCDIADIFATETGLSDFTNLKYLLLPSKCPEKR